VMCICQHIFTATVFQMIGMDTHVQDKQVSHDLHAYI
jgi:hypothetical protein